ncbi:zinc finger, CCHC-type containing protein [Tanacetum coccineum]
MHFLLTTLKVVYVLAIPLPELMKNDINVESAKELWYSLESKYMAEDASSKKFLNQVGNVGSVARLVTSKEIVVVVLSKKFLDFSITLKHGKDDLSLVQLDSHLRIEESQRAQESDKGKCKEVVGPSVNMTEEGDCRSGKKNNANAGGSGKGSKDQSQDQDFGATTHVCKDRCWFKIYELVEDRYVLYMGDDHFAPIHGKGSMAIEFNSEKTITLFNVLYVPKLRKNLVSGPMLNKCGLSVDTNRVVVRLPDPKRKVLSKKGIDCIFVGYTEHFKAYRFYVIEPNDYVSINSIIESRDAIFDENRFTSIPRPKDVIPNSVKSQRDDHSDDVPIEGSRDQVGSQYSYWYNIEEDLRTYDEAMQSRDAAFWKEAIDDEIGSIMENNTWVISDLPPGCKPLGCKWIFKRNMEVDGSIDKLLLALAAIYNLVIHQMDVKKTFLNGDLDEEVNMKQPKGFVMPSNEHKVCKLVKLLYELKQEPKQWHQKFDEVVLSSGFLLNQSDKCVYRKFDSSDMGEADVILGIKIKRENKGIVITQSHYIEKILKKFNREDCSPVSTPMDPVEKLKPNTCKLVDHLEYSRAIGYLMYALTSTRPDIAYAVGRLSRFTSNPSGQHWQAITKMFKYLKGTMNYGLSYIGYPLVLKGYSDASWINHIEDSSSTSGWVFLLGGGAIS